MLEYFRDNLKNKDIYLNITVDEGIQEKFIYTDKDKYDLMRKKNSNIEILKDAFNLSI